MIIAQPGQLRDSLQILLQTIPNMEFVVAAHDTPTALAMERHYCPALVLLDMNLAVSNELPLLHQMKQRCPNVRTIVMVDAEAQRTLCETAHVDVVLVKGVLATRLVAIIEELLAGVVH
jgi:DNA-binding NarL/FixJ family response regulator